MKVMGFRLGKFQLWTLGIVTLAGGVVGIICSFAEPDSRRFERLLFRGIASLVLAIVLLYLASKKKVT
jgi:uncharacterized membrane protein HdeD (DUF308 family)